MTINWTEFLLPYQLTVDELCLKFQNIKQECLLNEQFSPIESVTGRLKKPDSLRNKMKRKNITYDEVKDKIWDVAGIRIICRFMADIDTVLGIIRARQANDMEIIREADYVKEGKESGYRSYHVVIRYPLHTLKGLQHILAEIQIRTLAMDFWATIEHSLRYKYNGNIPPPLKKRLISSAEAAFRLDQEMDLIRRDIVEASRVFEIKQAIIDNSLKNLRSLYAGKNQEKANELNIEFLKLYQEDDLDQLLQFNNKLNTIANIYET